MFCTKCGQQIEEGAQFCTKCGTPVEFEHKGHRIILKNLPEEIPDKNCGITVFDMEFDEEPNYIFASYYPQLHGGEEFTDEKI